MKFLVLCALVLLCSVVNAQAPGLPFAHVHAEGVTFGVPWVYDQSGILQDETVTPSPVVGYQITAFDWAGRDPDLLFHSDDVVIHVDFGRR